MKINCQTFTSPVIQVRLIMAFLLNLVLLPAFAQTVTITGTPQETANISPGFRNRILYIFQVDVAGSTATLNGLTGLSTTGNYLTSDITTSGTSRGFRVHYLSQAGVNGTTSYQNSIINLDNVSASGVLSTQLSASTGNGQTINAPFNSPLSLPVGRHWLLLTADISPTAAIGRTIGLNSFTQANFAFSGTPTVTPVTFPASGLQTFKNATISLSAAVPVAASVERGIFQLQLYRVDITASGAATQIGDGNGAATLAFTLGGTVLGSGTTQFNNFRTIYSQDTKLDPTDQQMSNAINTPSAASPSLNANSLPLGIKEGTTRSVFLTTNTQASGAIGSTVRVVSVNANLPAGTTFAAGAAPASLPGGGLQTLASGAAQVTLEGIRTKTTQLLQGTENNLLGTVKVKVTGGTTALSQVALNVPGTFAATDYAAFKLWGSDSDVFDPATAVLLNTYKTGISPNNQITYQFPGVSQVINPVRFFPYFQDGTTKYIFFTVDIAPNAAVGRTVGISFNATNAGNTIIPGTRTVTSPTDAIPVIAINPQIQISTTLPAALNLPRGANNQVLYGLKLAVSNTEASFNGINIPVTTTNFADISGGYRLYYSTSDFLDLATATPVGTAQAATANSQVLTFTPVNPLAIASGATGYLYLVANTDPEAVLNNKVIVSAPALNQISFASGVKTSTATSVTQTISGPPQISLNPAIISGEAAAAGTKNIVFYGLNLTTTVADADFTGVTLTTAASGMNPADATNYRLYLSNNQTFEIATDQLIGTAIAGTGAGQTMEFNAVSPIRFPNGSTRTLFAVMDLGPNATVGNKVSIQALDPAQVRFVLGNTLGTPVAGPEIAITAPPAIAISSPAPTTINTPAGTRDVVLYQADVAVSNIYANFTGLNFSTTSAFKPNNIDGGYRLYFTTENTFNPATAVQVGIIAPSVSVPQRFEFAATQPIRLNPGTTGRFFLVTNISSFAKTGSQIGVGAIQLQDVLFESAQKSGQPAAGNTFVITQALAGSFSYPVTGPSNLSCANTTLPGKVLNITLPPYNADPTGVQDATAAFNLALSKDNSFVYIPNGTYRFTDSITWNLTPRVVGTTGGRGGANIIMWGESREGVTLKLDDNAAGFGNPDKPKIFIFTGETSPDRFGNSLHNLTINTGSGNSGTIGMRHFCNNYGGLYNVTIKSGDGSGYIGLDKSYSRANGPNLTKNVLVDGFNIGIRTDFAIESETYEHVTLRNQKQFGFYNLRQVLSIRDLKVENCAGTAFVNESGHVVLLDGNLSGSGVAAIRNDAPAKLLVRNLETSGYGQAIQDPQAPVTATAIQEWTSDAVVSISATPTKTTLNLPVNETPELPWDNPSTWVNVESFGATPGGVCNTTDPCRPCDDDAPKIQAAIDATLPGGSRAGATTLFIPGDYRIMSTVRIRGSIRRIVGAGGTLAAPYNGNHTQTGVPVPTLFVVENGTSPVIIFDNFTMGGSTTNGCAGCLGTTHFENSSGRTLVFRNITMGSSTFNGGDVYFESVSGSRDGLFTFNNANVWARQFNPERDAAKVIVNGGTFWCLGLKTEGHGEIVIARNQAKVEVFGAYVYSLSDSRNEPMFVVENSEAAINFFEYTGRWGTPYLDIIKETQKGNTLTLKRGAPSQPYPAPQPVTPPTYPATWSQRNDGTLAGIDDKVVGSNLVLFVSSSGASVNQAPQFTLSTDKAETLENADKQTMANFATGITDGNPELVQQLAFTVTTDNDALFDELPALDANTGTLTYKQKAGAFGQATVTVLLKDNGTDEMPNQNTSAPQTFTVSIKPVNDAPTLDALADKTYAFNPGEQNIPLAGISTGSEFETQILTFAVVSSNPDLITADVVYTSPEGTGTLQLAPAPFKAGTAVITVTLTDDGATDNGGVNTVIRSFNVIIEKGSQTITFDQLTGVLYGQPVTLAAISSSGLPVSYEVISGPAAVNGNILSLNAIGPVTLKATQTGDENYLAAAPVMQSFQVTTLEKAKGVKPLLECVTKNSDGTFTATFGYKNDMEVPVYIPVGSTNNISVAGVTPTLTFATHRVKNAFQVVFNNSVSWSVAGPDGKLRTVTATAASPACSSNARLALGGFEAGEETLAIYPNPTSGRVTVRVSAQKEQTARLLVINSLSEQVLIKEYNLTQGRNDLELSLQGLPSGVYSVQIYKDGGVVIEKVVITK